MDENAPDPRKMSPAEWDRHSARLRSYDEGYAAGYRAGVAAELERCAKLAESVGKDLAEGIGEKAYAAVDIATAIRSGVEDGRG